ncbi:MAG: nucleoside-diphosphate sugar epimerase/dehydratase [Elusimicrobiota bacterium]|jgi:FlaA1/EpsC-like NDP-sugar epimerase
MSQKVNPRRLGVMLLDVIVVLATYYLAFLLRFDFQIEHPFPDILFQTIKVVPFVYAAGAFSFGLYRGIYYFSSFSDLINIMKAVAASAIVTGALILFLRHGGWYPRSVLIIHPILVFLFVGGIRFGIRLAKNLVLIPRSFGADSKGVLLIGAGSLGESIARQMLNAPDAAYRVAGFLDDDKEKWGLSIHGCPVLGGLESLNPILDKENIQEIVVTIEDRRGQVVRSIAESLADRETKPELKIAPTLSEMLTSPGASLQLRKAMPADLLNRKVVRLELDRIAASLKGRSVLITGAGGTIGGELSRQCLSFKPARIILLDNHATSLFYAENDALSHRSPETEVVAILGDIRDRALLRELFERDKPQVVFHAAAHKHVSQLESNIVEGLSNNLLGTYRVAEAADKHGAESFLLISTDKAVRPAGIMGATKRAAELAILHLSQKSKTRFSAVRFGNVLGSSGSVLELFRRQMAAGGPLQVTHPEATRFFMTVEEAVQLVLEAFSLGRPGEVFILNMGTPVRIMDMAKNLLLLSGLTPGKDMEITVTGLRPGEKLHEELMEDPAGYESSGHPDILILRKENRLVEEFPATLASIEAACAKADPAAALKALAGLVPTYQAHA